MNQDALLRLLNQLLSTHSPGGDEGELDYLLRPLFHQSCQDVEQDSADNLVGVIRGTGERKPILVAAHKDELGMIVKRVESDGRLRIQELGGAFPWKYGEGLVDILTPAGVIQGVMSVGSCHTTEETPAVEQARERPLDWSMVRVFTRRTREELEALGVGPGTRVVVARNRKAPVLLEDCVCGYALDDKAALAVMLEAMRELAQGAPPPQDIYFAATSTEEQMGIGAPVLVGRLPIEAMLALEIGPVEPEYGLTLDDRPIVWYKDRLATYTKSFCDELVALGSQLGTGVQRAVYSRAVTDASASRQTGHVGRVAVLSFPATNSHGYEVAPLAGLLNLGRLLVAYLRGERG